MSGASSGPAADVPSVDTDDEQCTRTVHLGNRSPRVETVQCPSPNCNADLSEEESPRQHYLEDHLPEDFGLPPLGALAEGETPPRIDDEAQCERCLCDADWVRSFLTGGTVVDVYRCSRCGAAGHVATGAVDGQFVERAGPVFEDTRQATVHRFAEVDDGC